ncbi:MAG: hypothetical protein WHT06_16205 [Desulfobacterales bacterium]
MTTLSRLYNFGNDYIANQPIDDQKMDAELNQLVSGHNDQEGRIATLEGAVVKKDGSVLMTGPLRWDESGDEFIRLPRLNETQRDNLTSPTAGMVIYNTTASRFQLYTGSVWADLLSAVAAVMKTATPALRMIGTESGAKDFRLVESAGSLIFQVNTGTEASPTWTELFRIRADATLKTIALSTGQTRKLTKVSASSYNVVDDDDIILLDATSNNITVTLQAVSGRNGRALTFKRTDGSSNTVSIQRTGSDTIDGGTSVSLSTYANRYLVADEASSMWRTFS